MSGSEGPLEELLLGNGSVMLRARSERCEGSGRKGGRVCWSPLGLRPSRDLLYDPSLPPQALRDLGLDFE